MSQLNSLLESAGSGWKNMQSDAARLANKWEKTGLLEGFNKEVDKNNISLILENQAKQLVVEQSSTGGSANFSVGTGEQWAGIALPLVRKVFGQIAAKEFVSVQPMNLPSGLVFYLDFQYGDTKNPFTAGESLYGDRNSSGQFPFQTTDTAGGLYGAGRFTYSTNQTSSTVTMTSASNFSSASFEDVNFDTDFSASVARGEIKKIALSASTTNLADFDLDAVRGFTITSGSEIVAADNLPQFANYDYTNNTVNFFVTASNAELNPPAGVGVFTVFYNKKTEDRYRGDFEDSSSYAVPNAASATSIVIPQINVKMQSQAITAKTKKLKAVWTPEFAQDLAAYQNIDAEAELTNIMSEYISMEIDLEILDMLIEDAAAGTEYWSAVNNTVISGSAPTTLSSGFYNTQGQWFATLGTKLQKLSNKIH